MQKFCESQGTTFDNALETSATEIYRKALVSEMCGLLVLAIATHNSNKIKLRSALTKNLKFMKTELNPTLGPEEQNLAALSLLPQTLQTRVSQGLKLK